MLNLYTLYVLIFSFNLLRYVILLSAFYGNLKHNESLNNLLKATQLRGDQCRIHALHYHTRLPLENVKTMNLSGEPLVWFQLRKVKVIKGKRDYKSLNIRIEKGY